MDHLIGKHAWIHPHETFSWIPGKVLEVTEGDKLIVESIEDAETVVMPRDKAQEVHPSCIEGIPDLLSLGDFNEGALLHTVRTRYFKDEIYTSIGSPILISINPYTKLNIYTPQISVEYRKYSDKINAGADPNLVDIPSPHLYAVAESAYQAVRKDNLSQSIIISGESGAGKTEAAKIILGYLANASKSSDEILNKNVKSRDIKSRFKRPTAATTDEKPVEEVKTVEQQVLDSNPVLEAFGNAKTVRNDNSSRFGKFIEIHFDARGKIVSAKILNYLLEKSRIVRLQPEERNYHIFYQLCQGASLEEREQYYINEPSFYSYLNGSDCFEVAAVDDGQEFVVTKDCMKMLGFNDDELACILGIISGILHLGNVTFEEPEDDSGHHSTFVADPDAIEASIKAGHLLGVDENALVDVLTSKSLVDPMTKEIIKQSVSVETATHSRDALAKSIYGKLFDWLIRRINSTISVSGEKSSGKARVIGLLDIYGFEIFETNSFEQLCINYANEKLQQHFNHHIFKLEQAEYQKEKIQWSHISFEDNQPTIDFIEKKPICVFSILDDECIFGKGNDVGFLNKLKGGLGNNPVFCKESKVYTTTFGIRHYAGNVFYNVANFIDKNKDTVSEEHSNLMSSSGNALIQGLFKMSKNSPGGKGGRSRGATMNSVRGGTLAGQFKEQLALLMKTLSASYPRYIRCIKPNACKSPKMFDSIDVQRQLRCAGMLESIRIRKAGYSIRLTGADFLMRYKILLPGEKLDGATIMENCKSVFSKLAKKPVFAPLLKPDLKLYQVGISKVFMREELRMKFDQHLTLVLNDYAIVIQRFARGFLCRLNYEMKKFAILSIQKSTRCWLFKRSLAQRVELKKRKKKAIKMIFRVYWRLKRNRSALREINGRIEKKRQAAIEAEKQRKREEEIRLNQRENKISVALGDDDEDVNLSDSGSSPTDGLDEVLMGVTGALDSARGERDSPRKKPRKTKRKKGQHQPDFAELLAEEDLKNQISVLEEQLEKERKEKAELESKCTDLQSHLAAKSSEVEMMKRTRTTISASTKPSENTEEIGELHSKISTLQTSLSKVETDYELIKLDLESSQSRVVSLETENKSAKEKEKKWKGRLDEELEKYGQQRKEWEAQMKELTQESEKMKQLSMSFVGRGNYLDEDDDKERIESLEAELKAKKLKLGKVEAELASLQSDSNFDLENSQKQVTNLRSALSAREEELIQSQKELEKSTDEVVRREQELENMQEEFDRLQEELYHARGGNTNSKKLVREIADLRSQLDRAEKEHEKQKTIVLALKRQLANKDHEIVAKSSAIEELEHDLDTMHYNRHELNSKILEHEATIRKQEEEIYRKVLSDTNLPGEDYHEMKQKMSKLDQKVKNLQKAITDSENEVACSKKINQSLVTLLKWKNTQLDYMVDGDMDIKTLKAHLERLNQKEQVLLQKLEQQMASVELESEGEEEDDDDGDADYSGGTGTESDDSDL